MNGDFALAVHALVYLNHRAATLSSEALAENVCTNPARVRKVMGLLKRAGLVGTKEGAEGGYSFELDAEAVSLRRVAEAVDASFVSAAWRPGHLDADCMISSGMAGVLDGIYSDLDSLCKRRLEALTIASIDRQIFERKKGAV